ncbi:MAG: hypothetical protein J1F18_15235 [Lachnospiraceae bacterium]|nr:hypothetical protein [Lachnospiraceae bacterium]
MAEALSVISLIMTGIAMFISIVIVYKRCSDLNKKDRENDELLDSNEIIHGSQNEKREELQKIAEFVKQFEEAANESSIANELFYKMNMQSDELNLIIKSEARKKILMEMAMRDAELSKKQTEEIINQIEMEIDKMTMGNQHKKRYKRLYMYAKLLKHMKDVPISELESKIIVDNIKTTKTPE